MVTVREMPLWCVTVHVRGHDLGGECQIQTQTPMGAVAEVLSSMMPDEQAAIEYIGVARLHCLDTHKDA